ncbi:MAG: outer membrane beta-barrel protein, partial [Opitutaceae bacterium]
PSTGAPASTATIPGDDETTWRFVGNLTLQATHDDNITIRPTSEIDDYVFHVAPSLAFGIGNFRTALAPYAAIPHFIARTGEEDLPRKDYAFASYTPDAVFFREHDDENAVNHDVRVAARQERDLWNAHGELRFQRVTDADLDFGMRLRQTYYTASASGERSLTGKIFGGLGARAYRAEYAGGHASTDYRGRGYFDYQIAPKTRMGAGVTAGYLMVGSGADQTYQQPFVRLVYQPTAKLWFNARAGEEFRQYDSTIDDRSRFVFAVYSNYDASDATTFNLSARRETQSSAQYSDENIVATLYQAGVRQRFLQRVYLSLLGGFVRNQYENNAPTSFLDRRDDFTFYRATSSLDVTRRGTLELSYEHRENDSTLSNFDFNQNLVSLRASILF